MDTSTVSHSKVAYKGAIITAATILAYSLLLMAYTIIRCSVIIYQIMPRMERNSILFANGISLAWSVAILSLVMTVPLSVAGGLTAVILKKALLYFNPSFYIKKAVWIGGVLALVLFGILFIVLFALLGARMSFAYTEPFLFWFIFPGLIFMFVCMAGSYHLNAELASGLQNHIINL